MNFLIRRCNIKSRGFPCEAFTTFRSQVYTGSLQPNLKQLQKTHPMNECCSNNTNVHPLVRMEPNVMTARKINLRKPKCEHERARDVTAGGVSCGSAHCTARAVERTGIPLKVCTGQISSCLQAQYEAYERRVSGRSYRSR
jgi:hypothetical protein